MGGKSARTRKHVCLCVTLLALLSGCSIVSNWRDQRHARASIVEGRNLLMRGDYEASLGRFSRALSVSKDPAIAQAARYNIGLLYAHPNNPDRNTQKAIESFKQVATDSPGTVWGEQAKIWVSALQESESSKQDAERFRQEVEQSKQMVEKSKLDLEKYKQMVEKSRQEIEKTKQQSEKSKLAIEKSNQIDIEIEQKKRDRGK
jgi:tetratricopeptide (TPR) repeat protein